MMVKEDEELMCDRRGQYKTCEYCGANLDPEERCDCEKLFFQRSPSTGDYDISYHGRFYHVNLLDVLRDENYNPNFNHEEQTEYFKEWIAIHYPLA